ncbi:SUMF1/EgtB/PvdO family nonheme iron enzyme [Treponema sp. R80B11-R83G3]
MKNALNWKTILRIVGTYSRRLYAIALAAVIVFGIAACGDDSGGGGSSGGGGGVKEITSPTGIVMVRIPGGTFQMGKELGTDGGYEGFEATLTGFYIGKYELTQKQWQDVMGSLPNFNGSFGGGDNYPVYYVNWYDTLIFCNKLSVLEGLTPAYRINGSTDPDTWGKVPTQSDFINDNPNYTTWNAVEIVANSTGYRLPTGAQWEYAAKGGSGTPGNFTYAGSNTPDDVAWYKDNSELGSANYYSDTGIRDYHEVGKKAPNALGLYDMSGNVEEWCWDWSGGYPSDEAQIDPAGPPHGSVRVKRGGCTSHEARFITSTSGSGKIPYSKFTGYLDDLRVATSFYGFRVARPDPTSGPVTPPTIPVTLISVSANGSSTQNTTALTLTFDKEIRGLSADHITVSGVPGLTKGLSGSNPYTLTISGFTSSGTVTVTVARTGYTYHSYIVSGSPKTAAIYFTDSISTSGIYMVSIPARSFTMGQTDISPPEHSVTLSAFFISKYLVTQEQYQLVMGTNPSSFSSSPQAGETQGKRPVEMVSWYDALVFCNKLSAMDGLSPAYSISGSTDPAAWGSVPTSSNATWNAVEIVAGSTGYRLPTEAQWECACRAGTTTVYNTGDTISDDTGWYTSNSGRKTHEVGLKPANAWGLYDMHGNVWEWCWDWYSDSYYSSSPTNDPMGASSGDYGTYRVMRGGSYIDSADALRSAYRVYRNPYAHVNDLGFRLIRPW